MIKNKFNILPIILLILTLSIVAFAGSPLPDYKPQFFDANGNPLTSGSLKLCNPGTTNVKTIYTNSGLTVPKANPVNLDSSGRAEVWLNGTYDVYLYDGQNATGNLIYTLYNISSISAAATPFTPNYIDASEYGDLTATITTLGITTPYEVWVTDQQTLTDDTTIPANITLRVIRGGIIVSDGYKLTFTGPLEANHNQQIFTGFTADTNGVSWNSGEVVYPEWWGAVGDGSTDDTDKITAALATGLNISLRPGATYLVSHLSRTGNVVIRGDIINPPTFKHKSASTDDLIDITGNLELYGIKFDGNRLNQTGRYNLVDFSGAYVNVEKCIFTGSVHTALVATVTSTGIVKGCTFKDMAEHGGTAGQTSLAGYFASSSSVRLWVQDNDILADTPADVDSAPGGFQFSGSAMSIDITDNFFRNIGQRKAGNLIGCIDLYTDCDKSIVSRNRFDTFWYIPLKLQNSSKLIVTENIIDGEGDSSVEEALAISYARTFGSSLNTFIVSKNIFNLNGSIIGMYLQGSAAEEYSAERIIISENQVYNAVNGLELAYKAKTVLITNNIFSEISQNAVKIYNIGETVPVTVKSVGNIYDKGSHTSYTPLYARDNNTYLKLSLIGDTFLGTVTGYDVSVRDADSVFIDGCDFSDTTTTPIDILTVTHERVTASNMGLELTHTTTGIELKPYGTDYLDSSENVGSATLGSGQYLGQLKLIAMTAAGNNFTVYIYNHETSDPELALFDAVDEYWLGVWTGTEWATVEATCTFP